MYHFSSLRVTSKPVVHAAPNSAASGALGARFVAAENVPELEQLKEKSALSAAIEEVVEVEADENPETEEGNNSKEERDPGVSDEDWEELEHAKEAHAAHLKVLRRARDQTQLEEELRCAAAIQEKFRRICSCPVTSCPMPNSKANSRAKTYSEVGHSLTS
ncbi:unnamed protein product [Phytophthora lilii]|uniref:Unnamed protein product n=1 Tax=Phytophthora lilii TaxID=2077276 RepID=A0A9W7CP76_9STRA|nr:unnamed protein product [Phytophthora lilii]